MQFIATVLHDPEIVIFDEPFSGFDPVNAELIREEMLKPKTAGKTILLSGYRMDQVKTLVDELLLLRRGRAVRRGTVTALKAEVPVRRYVLEWEPAEEEAAGGRAAEAGRTAALPRDPGVRWIEMAVDLRSFVGGRGAGSAQRGP